MSLRFQIRSTQLDAYITHSKKDWYPAAANGQTPALVNTTTSGLFGGSMIDLRGQVGPCGIGWPFTGNVPNTGPITILIRIVPTWTGAPPSVQLYANAFGSDGSSQGFYLRHNTNGTVNFNVRDKSQGDRVNCDFATLSSAVAGVPMDIAVTWDGSNSAGSAKLYTAQAGNAMALHDTENPSAAFVQRYPYAVNSFNCGIGVFGDGDFYLNELCYFDEVFDVAGLGARTNFVTSGAAAFEGASNSNPGIANVRSGTGYTIDGVSLTGTMLVGTDPATTDVRSGVSWLNGTTGVTSTGSLLVPTQYTGTSSLVNFAQIKENLRYILDAANTTTADIDLSGGLSDNKRVRAIMTRHPGKLPAAPQEYPYVAMFIDAKDINLEDMASSQARAKRTSRVKLKIVGGVVNNTIKGNPKKDAADDDCERLMENIEGVLRRYPDLGGECLWQFPSGVTFHNRPFDEEAHLRVGIMTVEIAVLH